MSGPCLTDAEKALVKRSYRKEPNIAAAARAANRHQPKTDG
ncbi:hypothetical protein ElP_28370 [Tautonia plasticadhaerens]|uniref:Uncharacterized protein n=1 Tax=Tautonia plasticadhaerens TaxID=2527974 RepID=A0A518H299_9BACT|nr:hypothetical protein ElP_28370 [Tautonia plasticadhaerens]